MVFKIGNEHGAFNEYSKARDALLDVLDMSAKGQASRSDVAEKMHAEIEAFDKYVIYRSIVRRHQ